MWHIVEQDRAGTAFGAVATEFRSGESQLISQRPRQRFLLHDVDAATLPIDVYSNEPRSRAAGAVDTRTAEQIARRRDGPHLRR